MTADPTVAVVGRGPIGAAAARHLATMGAQVVLVGPDEPADKANHRGVFASHYDEGRITRRLDPDPFWSRVSAASIDRYDEIASAGGDAFFTATGAMLAGPAGGDFLARTAALSREASVGSEWLEGAALSERFPDFVFAPGTAAIHEPGGGHLSPRRLVAAQTRAGEALGVRVVRAEASALERAGGAMTVTTQEGEIRADRVLVAAGGFTNALLPRPLPISVYARTIAFFEVDAVEAARLVRLPTLIEALPDGQRPYLLPPICYPDGRILLKLGGDRVDVTLASDAEIRAWFRSGSNPAVGAELEAHMRTRMPGLEIRKVTIGACVTTFTAKDRPVIDRLDDGLYVATAGCGRAAKCSDELGRLAACRVLDIEAADLAETTL